MGMLKPLKGSLHRGPGIYFKRKKEKERGEYVQGDKEGKDAVADSLLIMCPSAACLSTLPARY